MRTAYGYGSDGHDWRHYSIVPGDMPKTTWVVDSCLSWRNSKLTVAGYRIKGMSINLYELSRVYE